MSQLTDGVGYKKRSDGQTAYHQERIGRDITTFTPRRVAELLLGLKERFRETEDAEADRWVDIPESSGLCRPRRTVSLAQNFRQYSSNIK